MQSHLVNVTYPHSKKSGKTGNGRYIGIVDKVFENRILVVLVGDDMLPLLDQKGKLLYRSFSLDKVVGEIGDLGKVSKASILTIDRLR